MGVSLDVAPSNPPGKRRRCSKSGVAVTIDEANDKDTSGRQILKTELDCCSICLDWFVDPCVGPCGHVYCLSCWESWAASQMHRPSCPTCRTTFLQPLGVCLKLKAVTERLDPHTTAKRRADIQSKASAARAGSSRPYEEFYAVLNSLDGVFLGRSSDFVGSDGVVPPGPEPTTPRSGSRQPSLFDWDPTALLQDHVPVSTSYAAAVEEPPFFMATLSPELRSQRLQAATTSAAAPAAAATAVLPSVPAAFLREWPPLPPLTPRVQGAALDSSTFEPPAPRLFVHTQRPPAVAASETPLHSWASDVTNVAPPAQATLAASAAARTTLLLPGVHVMCSSPSIMQLPPLLTPRSSLRARAVPVPLLRRMSRSTDWVADGPLPLLAVQAVPNHSATGSPRSSDQTFAAHGPALSGRTYPGADVLRPLAAVGARMGVLQEPAWHGGLEDAALRHACTCCLLELLGVDCQLTVPRPHVMAAVQQLEADIYATAHTRAEYLDDVALRRHAHVLKSMLSTGRSVPMPM